MATSLQRHRIRYGERRDTSTAITGKQCALFSLTIPLSATIFVTTLRIIGSTKSIERDGVRPLDNQGLLCIIICWLLSLYFCYLCTSTIVSSAVGSLVFLLDYLHPPHVGEIMKQFTFLWDHPGTLLHSFPTYTVLKTDQCCVDRHKQHGSWWFALGQGEVRTLGRVILDIWYFDLFCFLPN